MPVEQESKAKGKCCGRGWAPGTLWKSWILKKIETSNEHPPNKLQFCFIAGTGEDKLEKKPGENSTDSPFANLVRSSRQSSECGKTKASLCVITAYQ